MHDTFIRHRHRHTRTTQFFTLVNLLQPVSIKPRYVPTWAQHVKWQALSKQSFHFKWLLKVKLDRHRYSQEQHYLFSFKLFLFLFSLLCLHVVVVVAIFIIYLFPIKVTGTKLATLFSCRPVLGVVPLCTLKAWSIALLSIHTHVYTRNVIMFTR